MTPGEQKGLGLGNGKALDDGSPATTGLHGVALAVAFLHEVINKACEKDPKHIEQYLG
jgi:hypothetical protein